MTDKTPRGTRSQSGPNASESMPGESNEPEAKAHIAKEAQAQTAESDDAKTPEETKAQ